MNSYREQALKAVYSIIASLNILGNPSKIAREFSGGIDNLLDNHGDDSVKVIAEGAGVIAKNSMAGYALLTSIFGGLNASTGSLAGLVSLLSADAKFMKLRGLRRRRKAKNVLQGFEQGAQSLFSGFSQGLYGVAYQPYLNLKQRGGISGLLLGAAKGITGLISKPISGILDTVSKTAEVRSGERRASRTRLEAPSRSSRGAGLHAPSTTKTWS